MGFGWGNQEETISKAVIRLGKPQKLIGLVTYGFVLGLAACSGGSDLSDSVVIEGSPPIAYVQRTVDMAGNPTDGLFNNGSVDLSIRGASSPVLPTQTLLIVTHMIQMGCGPGTCPNPKVSHDAERLFWSMRCSGTASAAADPGGTNKWNIWGYDIRSGELFSFGADVT